MVHGDFKKTKHSKIPCVERALSLLMSEDVAASVRFPRYTSVDKDYTDEKVEGLRGSINITEFALSWYIGNECVQSVRWGDSTFQHMSWDVLDNGDFLITIDAYHFAPDTDKGSIEYTFCAQNSPALMDKLCKKRFTSMFSPLAEAKFTERCPEMSAKAGECAVM